MKDNDLVPLAQVLEGAGCSRRQFCAHAGVGLAVIGVAACGVGPDRVLTGGLDNPEDPSADLEGHQGPPPDFAGHKGPIPDMSVPQQQYPDMTMKGQPPPPDLKMSSGMSCSSGFISAGAASAIAVGSAKHLRSGNNYDVYVCRDSGGLFCIDSACTHSGCTVVQSGTKWHCPCHGANFNFDGSHPTAPAFSPLPHYAMCVDGNGNASVDLNTNVDPSIRY